MTAPNETTGPLRASKDGAGAAVPPLAGLGPNPEAPPVWQLLPREEPLAQAEVAAAATKPPDAPQSLDSPAAPEVPPAAASSRYARARRARSTTILLVVSGLVALGGVSFAIGRATSTGQTGTAVSNVGANGSSDFGGIGAGPNASGAPGDFGGRDFAGAAGTTTLSGTVVSVSADAITLELANGQTVTVATGSSTTYHDQTSATSSDITTGSTVIVQTTTGASAASSAGASASPGGLAGTRTAIDVTVTSK